MFSKNRFSLFSLFIIVFVLLVMVGVGLKAHWYHVSSEIDLDFTSEPEITCSIDGWTFTHTKITGENGQVEQDWWWRVPENPVFKIEAQAHGGGYAHVIFHGKYDVRKGQAKYGDPKNSTDYKLGKWVEFTPFGIGVDHDIVVRRKGTFTYDPKTYNWEGDGSIKLVPWYWKWQLALAIPTGSWEPAPDEFHKELTVDADGSWVVNHNHNKKKPQIRRIDDDDDNQNVQPGDSVTLELITDEPFYNVSWYVHTPWDTSSSGTYQQDSYGDGTATTASFTYTIPTSGTTEVSGNFVFRASVYSWSDMSYVGDASYTVSVSNSNTSPSSSTSPSESSTWLYCVKCEELYMPIYNSEGSCLEGGLHKDSY